MTTGRKLAIFIMLVAGGTAYLAYFGAAGGWQYYLTVDECLTDVASLTGNRIRVSGKVAGGSLQIAADRRQADFLLQGVKGKLTVSCKGPIPDNLAENMDVVVEGRLQLPGKIEGEKVLTRCASKYESKNKSASTQNSSSNKTEPAS